MCCFACSDRNVLKRTEQCQCLPKVNQFTCSDRNLLEPMAHCQCLSQNNTCECIYMQMDTHVHTHTCTHTRAHTHVHTHTHTHVRAHTYTGKFERCMGNNIKGTLLYSAVSRIQKQTLHTLISMQTCSIPSQLIWEAFRYAAINEQILSV